MKIYIGSDHGGFLLKEGLKSYLSSHGINVYDVGCDTIDSCDYPDYAHKVAEAVALKHADFGVLVCSTGIGMSIAANRHKGVRASLVRSGDEAYLTRLHNDSNILCLGEKYTSLSDAKEIIDLYLNTKFEQGRHIRRIEKIERN